ncbi:hypothetical protein CASFOL_006066 [Castilleja foliolosa]|uniref:Uncharacterized protein n=1 Tax=Castilleja foliolosa TaxID=1961234 RepID=A0ABD3E5A8_9LAMI
MMGPEKKRQQIESSMENTEDSEACAKAKAKSKALVLKATESGAFDYSCFPPKWLGYRQTPMLACEGSDNYATGLEMASFALDRIKDDPQNDGKTFKVVCVDKICIIFFNHYVMQFFVREVVADGDATADAPLKTLQARLYYPNSVEAEVVKWRWFHPSQGV